MLKAKLLLPAILFNLFLLIPIQSVASCHSVVTLGLENNCPWPVTFNYSDTDHNNSEYVLSPGKTQELGNKEETTFTVTDSHNDKATVWLHSGYSWSKARCEYFYTPRNLGANGYTIKEETWRSGHTPKLDLVACQTGAKTQIKTIGLGQISITKNGLYQKDNQTINLTEDDVYRVNFTSTGSYCSIKLGQNIYCSHTDIGSLFITGNIIFACQQVQTPQGRCSWVINQDDQGNGPVNFMST